jgi:hypothetical protein
MIKKNKKSKQKLKKKFNLNKTLKKIKKNGGSTVYNMEKDKFVKTKKTYKTFKRKNLSIELTIPTHIVESVLEWILSYTIDSNLLLEHKLEDNYQYRKSLTNIIV